MQKLIDRNLNEHSCTNLTNDDGLPHNISELNSESEVLSESEKRLLTFQKYLNYLTRGSRLCFEI